MLFLVPDADAPPDKAPAAPAFKVELDLDGAPFLEEPVAENKKDTPAEKPAEEPPSEADPARTPRWRVLLQRLKANKKKLLAAAAACVVLGLGTLAATVFLFGEEKPAPPPGPLRVVVPSQPQANATEQPPVFLINWEPFLVERRGEEGEIRFLYCRFATPTENQLLQMELEAKKVTVRDAIYYYLSNKPLTFLSDAARQQDLKADIISVINEHVSSAKLSELYFEEYVVRGS